jgi:hypothetical protein
MNKQTIQTIKNIFPHVFWVVVIIGVIIALSKGYSPTDFTWQTWGNISVVISIILGVSLCFKIYKQEIIDRLLLGLALFVFVGSIGYLGNISSILYYYGNCPFVILFACLALVGIVTFFTPAGFIGVESDDKNKVYSASLKLFAIVIFGGLWSLYAQIYLNSLFILQVLAIRIMRSAYDRLGDQVRGKKSKGSWTFKWKY